MRGMLFIFVFIAVAALCWGGYGPVLQRGQQGMATVGEDGKPVSSPWRPFACVGIAYFLLAVLVPGALLAARGEVGAWTVGGAIWSTVAGAAGALGALGIIMALKNHGDPVYVMPLVFGGAPVVNTFMTMYMHRSYKEVGPLFLAGLILVVAGAATVLVFRPALHGPGHHEITAEQFALVGLWTAVTALSWGVYGPTLHKGQMKMTGSRLRPLMCVGLAYFLIAVLVPAAVLAQSSPPGHWTPSGTAWSLAGGAAGAIGAIGIIMAFNFGGRPIYVMPLVFGGAPVINTFVSIMSSSTVSFADCTAPFYAGLIIVAVGAVVVLVFAPKPKHVGGKPSHAPAVATEPAKA